LTCSLYALDFARVYPAEPPATASTSLSYLVKVLRPELVRANPVPLSSDAFSPFGAIDSVRTCSRLRLALLMLTASSVARVVLSPAAPCVLRVLQTMHDDEVRAAFQRLVDVVIPRFVDKLERGCAANAGDSGVHIDVADTGSVEVLSCGCRVAVDDEISRFVASPALGAVFGDKDFNGGLNREASSGARASSVREYDFNSIIEGLHADGINMRHCGKVYERMRCQLWRRRLRIEMAARAIKVRALWSSS
jgi:hypothetical protein